MDAEIADVAFVDLDVCCVVVDARRVDDGLTAVVILERATGADAVDFTEDGLDDAVGAEVGVARTRDVVVIFDDDPWRPTGAIVFRGPA